MFTKKLGFSTCFFVSHDFFGDKTNTLSQRVPADRDPMQRSARSACHPVNPFSFGFGWVVLKSWLPSKHTIFSGAKTQLVELLGGWRPGDPKKLHPSQSQLQKLKLPIFPDHEIPMFPRIPETPNFLDFIPETPLDPPRPCIRALESFCKMRSQEVGAHVAQKTTRHHTNKAGWWLNRPIWKICSSNWIISPSRDENLKKIETTNQKG